MACVFDNGSIKIRNKTHESKLTRDIRVHASFGF